MPSGCRGRARLALIQTGPRAPARSFPNLPRSKGKCTVLFVPSHEGVRRNVWIAASGHAFKEMVFRTGLQGSNLYNAAHEKWLPKASTSCQHISILGYAMKFPRRRSLQSIPTTGKHRTRRQELRDNSSGQEDLAEQNLIKNTVRFVSELLSFGPQAH
jgi:hypothetical protein